jgi:predicted SAM-dependent methyltransferase
MPFWRMVAPAITRSYRERWLSSDKQPKILNLGGGSVLHERWLTADIDPRSDVWTDITRSLPFPNDSIDIVYLEEVIEHIGRDQGDTLLRECHRILKPGGSLRLTTPSLDYFIALPLDETASVLEINRIFLLHGHRHIYSRAEMRNLLAEAGFNQINESSFRDSESPMGEFDTHPERFPEAVADCSQYWDATT